MISPLSNVIFDFDLTLADSSRGACACIDYSLVSLGLPSVPAAVAVRTIGLSLPDTLKALVPDAEPDLAPEFARLFLQRAGEVMADLTEVYSAVPAALDALRQAGMTLAIVSTKYRARIEAILAREDLGGAFSVIVAGDDVAHHKPDPTGLLAAIDSLDSTPAETIYIGDSTVDAETARRAGTAFVATLTGTTTQAEFSRFIVDGFVDHLGQLPALLLGPQSVNESEG